MTASYTVAPGDSMWAIANAHGIALNDLIAANPQVTNPSAIEVGQVLNLPGSTAAASVSSSSSSSSSDDGRAGDTRGGYVVPAAAAPAPGQFYNNDNPYTRAPPPPPPGAPTFKTVAYFTNWGIYGRNYQPQDVPAEYITHILYSFANIRPSGEVFLTDTYSDLEKHYPSDSWSETGDNAYGCIKQFFLLKQKHRHLKTLLSIGGWTYSPNFAAPASTPEGRTTFARSAVRLLADLGFDGIDIDWEYPQTADEAANFVQLLAAVRAELDAYSSSVLNGQQRLLLTIAAPCGPKNISTLLIPQMDPYLDIWNLMCYDFAGSWDSNAGHQANVFSSHRYPASTPFSAHAAIQAYITAGVHPSKIIFGLPLYGRAFENTAGPGAPFSGVGEGSWENGVWDYKDLPTKGCGADAVEYVDEEILASWSLSPSAKKMVTYDTPAVARLKARYIRDMGLGGAMWWELSGDLGVGEERSLIRTTVEALGGLGALERSGNVLEYPGSRFENIRNGCRGG